jgi:hypothetical protein
VLKIATFAKPQNVSCNIMTTTTETNILTTRPSIKSIGFAILGTIFFGAFAYLMLPTSKWTVVDGTDYTTGLVIMWMVLGGFVFFSTSCFFWLLSMKTITLTDKNLIIKRPLLLLKFTIPLSNIKGMVDADFQINSSHNWRTFNVFSGDQIIIELKNGKKIKFNSFEISDYYLLTKNLNKLLRSTKQLKFVDNQNLSTNKFEGYGWLVFIILLTFGLVYSIIRQGL